MAHTFDVTSYQDDLVAIIRKIVANPDLSPSQLRGILRQHPRDGCGLFSQDEIIQGYRALAGTHGLPPFDPALVERLQRKPIRTLSGVTPVTVLTKPFPCPGTCIFCPSDVRMPKSYVSTEPGAQRAKGNAFDPYLQAYNRLTQLHQIGHNTDKIELIVLGGTWSFYPEPYQIWFVKRLFDALNDFSRGVDQKAEIVDALCHSPLYPANLPAGSVDGRTMSRTYNQMMVDLYPEEIRLSSIEQATWRELASAQQKNETAVCRCVGLVVETRPDYLDSQEAIRLRRLGCTKIQIGIQSWNDTVLRLNQRGHTVERSRQAIRALRQAGFKIHAHWMPNLYGSNPVADQNDFQHLFRDPGGKPDELKVYPCSLLESAELMSYYQRGEWRPYSEKELLEVLLACFQMAPEYCRLTRVIRDIPATDIIVGNKKTNFRQIVEKELARRNLRSQEIRSREIRGRPISAAALSLKDVAYTTSVGEEIFLQYVTGEDRIAGFLRLSLPTLPPILAELQDAAMIREVHVYGRVVAIGQSSEGRAQHLGLGQRLIEHAAALAKQRGYQRLAVISSVGTRGYYRKRGFYDGEYYQFRTLR